jgi:predicted CoA-binding protein
MLGKPSVAILGASTDRRKYGNKSVRAHLHQGFDVYPVNPKADMIEGIQAYPNLAAVPVQRLSRISVYLPPEVGLKVLDEIVAKGADEIWFNPGSDSDEVITRARQLGLKVVQACSIVAVGMSPSVISDT